MPKTSLSVVIVAVLAGCTSPESDTRDDRTSGVAQEYDQRGATAREDDRRPMEAQRDQNRQEAERDEPTAQDQPNTGADLRITQEVRQRVVENDELSFGAKNVTIVSEDGVVTLRGEVESQQERTLIAELAQSVDGVHRINDQLTYDTD